MSDKKYIVMFNPKADKVAEHIKKAKSDVINNGGQITHEYGLSGFAAVIPTAVLSSFQSSFNSQKLPITSIEEDSVVTIQ